MRCVNPCMHACVCSCQLHAIYTCLPLNFLSHVRVSSTACNAAFRAPSGRGASPFLISSRPTTSCGSAEVLQSAVTGSDRS